MKNEDSIQKGLSSKVDFLIEEKHSASHIGSGSVNVLATPSMIAFMEITARKLLDQHLPDSDSTVGARVDVRHLAACAVGQTVTAIVEVIDRENRRVNLNVQVSNGEQVLGSGSHERVIVNKEKFLRQISS
jgi:predicted thioesterase